MNIFLDTNVVIDFLADRPPFSINAAKLFSLSKANKVHLFISAVSYNNIYYILRQSVGHAETVKLLNQLSEFVEVADVNQGVIQKALKNSLFKDFEDAIQYYSALGIAGLACIVTRDPDGFKKSSVPVLNPLQAAALTNTSI